MVNGKDSDSCEEPQERNVRVFYKLKVNEDPTLKNMPHKEDFNDDNYESIEEKEQLCEVPPLIIYKFLHTIFWCVNVYGLMYKEAHCASTYKRCT